MTGEVIPQKLHIQHFQHAEFEVDAVLFDMDGTLVDSIGAVEGAWGSVAVELGKDPQEVIDATHGRRAIDNLKDLKPELRRLSEAQMDPHVQDFETKILDNADAYSKEVRSRRESVASSRSASRRASRSASGAASPFYNDKSGSNSPRSLSRSGSMSAGGRPARKGSFAAELTKRMAGMQMSKPATPVETPANEPADGIVASPTTESPRDTNDDVFLDDDEEEIDIDSIQVDTSDLTDNSVIILPGVREMIDSIPHGKWCVATSGATTYCHGALKRVGIELPPVVVTADHKELKRGKPFPDPFILAAEKMGYDVNRCLVVEDSPSGIKAGIASGAKVIAVCTSHPVEKIKDLVKEHYLVPTLEKVKVVVQPSGRLLIKITA